MISGDTDNCKMYLLPWLSFTAPCPNDLPVGKNLLLVMFIYLYIVLLQKWWKAKNGLSGFTVTSYTFNFTLFSLKNNCLIVDGLLKGSATQQVWIICYVSDTH